MREILFRGKEKGSGGAWVFGDLFHSKKPDLVFISNYDNDDYKEYNVIPETVGQYTGLEDRHGAKIFEGDLCLCDRNINDRIDKIVFKIKYYEFCGFYGESKHGNEITAENFDMCEKIGNEHDDHEIFEGEYYEKL